MKNINKVKTGVNFNPNILTIHDCLKLIGMKEIAANIYSLPKKVKK